MRWDIFLFAAGAVLTALSIRYANRAWLWDGTIFLGAAIMATCLAYGVSTLSGRKSYPFFGMIICAGAAVGFAVNYFTRSETFQEAQTPPLGSPLKFIFADTEPREKSTDFIAKSNLVVPDQPIEEGPSLWTVSFKLRNDSDKTVKNVQASVASVAYGPKLIDLADAGLINQNSKVFLPVIPAYSGSVQIRPIEPLTFQLAQFLDPKPVSYLRTLFVTKEQFQYFKWISDPHTAVTGTLTNVGIPELQGGIPLQRAFGQFVIDVVVYADDVPPTYARFAFRPLQDRLSVTLAAQGLSLPNLSDLDKPVPEDHPLFATPHFPPVGK